MAPGMKFSVVCRGSALAETCARELDITDGLLFTRVILKPLKIARIFGRAVGSLIRLFAAVPIGMGKGLADNEKNTSSARNYCIIWLGYAAQDTHLK
jgi:hypothetical protein